MGALLDACSPIQNVQIRGKVAYSRIHKKIEGEELQIQNEKRKARGQSILVNSPYYILVLENAVIVNAQALPAEVVQYFNSKIKSQQNPDGTFTTKYYAMSKSKFEPIVVYSKEAGDELANGAEIKLRAELETGMDVTIGACIFKASIGKGVGFDYVLLNEPIRYYNGSGATAAITAALANQGIVYKNETIIEPDDDAETATPYGDENTNLPFTAQLPPLQAQTPPTPMPQGMPVSTTPPVQPQTPPAAPVQPQTPVQPQMAQPVPPVQPQAPYNVQIPPQVPQTPPQSDTQPTGGITYNPLQYGPQ